MADDGQTNSKDSQGILQNRRYSIVIDDQDKVWAPERRSRHNSSGSISRKKVTNLLGNEIQMQEVHLGHSEVIRRKSAAYLRKELENDYHEVDLEVIFRRLGSNFRNGLTSEQVKINEGTWGKNVLTPPKKQPLWIKFLKTLVGGFQLLLWIGAILCYIAYIAQCITSDSPPADNLGLGSTLALLALVLGLFTFYQEYSCNKVMESFSNMIPNYANVIRDGRSLSVDAKELVVGDIVEIKFGDRIPADIRILECQGFKVDNSSLTGESDPQSRGSECTDENPLETRNMAFFSTLALEGTAKGIVVCVGDSSFIGRIAGLASGLDASDTPMAREISAFVKMISAVAVTFGLIFFVISSTMGYSWMGSCLFLIGVIIANVPEGLLVTFTVILALTAKKMAAKNCLVRHLHAVETLGSTSVICSDKTGTLTQNKMTATHAWFNNFVVSTDISKSEINMFDQGFRSLSRCASLCTRAKFMDDQDKSVAIQQWRVNGDASESAILRFMETYNGNVNEYQEKCQKVFEIPFNSANKWQLSIHNMNDPKDPRFLLVMKGAPEIVLSYCKYVQIGRTTQELNENWIATVGDACQRLGEMGERVLGFCEVFLPNNKYPHGYVFDEENLEFLEERSLSFVGLISMVDPPRPGVPDAVQSCRNAGIKVVMVTGDHPTTAKAIAKSVGIISEGSETVEDTAKRLNIEVEQVDATLCNAVVVKGSELLEMTSEELEYILKEHTEIVFARVSPQQKLVIVEAFQRLGRIVAVTGDGVNDSPALKKADIGIAMGIAGSDVSKQAADMILLDDDFTSIVYGVEEGRLIFDNLKKCICYLLTANTAELLPFVIYFVFKVPLPLGTIPMLMVCLGTDILPTISLSYETAEADIMKRPPRNPIKDKLVTDKLVSYSYGQLGIIEAAAAIFTYLVVLGQNGFYLNTLLGLQPLWDSHAVNDLQDSYGQEWVILVYSSINALFFVSCVTYYNRKRLERTCWTAAFCAIVVCQWGNVLVSKMRRLPLYTKIFDNWVIFAAIVGETALACFLAYTPVLNEAISYLPIRFYWWLAPLPFCMFLIIHDEVRRFLLRNCPSWTWYQQEFYY